MAKNAMAEEKGRARAMHIDNFKTKITADHMSQARAIPIKNIDYGEGTQSRAKGVVVDAKAGFNSHLKAITQSIRYRLDNGKPLMKVPIVVEALGDDKYEIVLGHHRIRGHIANTLESIDSLEVTFSDDTVPPATTPLFSFAFAGAVE